MDKENQIKWSLNKLKGKLDIICCIHEGNDTLKTENTDKFEHREQIDLISDITRHYDAKNVVEWYSRNNVNDKHTFKVLYLYVSDISYFLAGLWVLVSCPEIEDDINEKEKVNEEVHVIDKARNALIFG